MNKFPSLLFSTMAPWETHFTQGCLLLSGRLRYVFSRLPPVRPTSAVGLNTVAVVNAHTQTHTLTHTPRFFPLSPHFSCICSCSQQHNILTPHGRQMAPKGCDDIKAGRTNRGCIAASPKHTRGLLLERQMIIEEHLIMPRCTKVLVNLKIKKTKRQISVFVCPVQSVCEGTCEIVHQAAPQQQRRLIIPPAYCAEFHIHTHSLTNSHTSLCFYLREDITDKTAPNLNSESILRHTNTHTQ